VIDRLIKSITEEYNITTIVNTHDMNSVMEIGDNIVFIKKGYATWQGSRQELFTSENQDLNEFIFASGLFKDLKKAHVVLHPELYPPSQTGAMPSDAV
jgi:phospholipid/cholesterol/gamma-HCH transport system ATP-binding protein